MSLDYLEAVFLQMEHHEYHEHQQSIMSWCAITIHNCHNFLEKLLEKVSGEESYGELRPTQMPLYVLRCQWVADQNGVRVEEKWRARAHGSAILADHPASRPPRVHQHIKICEASVQRCRGDGMSVVRALTYYIIIYIILDLYYFRILDSYYNANILTCTVQVNHIHKLLTSGCCSLGSTNSMRSSEQTLGSWYNSQIIEGSRVSRDTMIAFLQLRDIHHYSAFFSWASDEVRNPLQASFWQQIPCCW